MSNHSKQAVRQPFAQEHTRLIGSERGASISSTSFAHQTQDLICFSHLRWNFVYQRPQHLLSRASRHFRVWFWEEPVADQQPWLEVRPINPKLHILVPHLPAGTDPQTQHDYQRRWLQELLAQQQITDFVAWYYTPMALNFTEHIQPRLTVYDCMDELSAFRGAPPQLREREKQLMQQAQLMFTGGQSLYEAKKNLHPSVHAFPSSIDNHHFGQARLGLDDPADQQALAYPRIGFSGVIDERLDIQLLGELARRRPDWQFVLLGPVVKIDPASLPQGPNLHYLGMKAYEQLPAYFSNWQVAWLPFALNESTRFISPTKTPEYLAAGLPVVSTPIRDVVSTYGECGTVWIADGVEEFERSIEAALQNPSALCWSRIDAQLAQCSWQQTWKDMHTLILEQFQLQYQKHSLYE
ncbi:glycosyl transferase family 1 [Larkinella arboricola]|uniref:Glycosyl transferase family 1 n=1 Tax=Larkinella arboricola TaxID=643671 RepID=A0A327WS40_LARAB|nr:glycosyltransferase family 1 protein [Larkinella arboricola]RAJ94122.1 glycosyl transferase family 1 [Larkinella arboricola]